MKMLQKMMVCTAASGAFALAGAAQASTVLWDTSGGDSGGATSFDGSGFATLEEAYTAAHDGTGVFSSTNFSSTAVNVFFVDFSGAGGQLANAGVAVIVAWGNSGSETLYTGSDIAGSFWDYQPNIQTGDASNSIFTANTQEVFAWGSAVINNPLFPGSAVGVTEQESPLDLPTGFAITNLGESISLNFTAAAGIDTWELFSAGSDDFIAQGGGGQNAGFGQGNTLHVAIPLPAPVWMGLAGLAGVMIARRRSV